MTPALILDGIGKRFLVSHLARGGLKDRTVRWLRREKTTSEEFWALRDVSLSLARGEMVGILGANGSGKSTLLQVAAGIHVPDTGSVVATGRVRALLELGAGFSPDLSGRENVFLNGALLGFSRAEIARRFDAIVGFAELEPFIDMPLRTYSSGMQIRLGFSVAAHFDPEILLLDEGWAVGDARFQQRCLQRVIDIRRGGAAVLFVSHDLFTVEQLCDRAALLERGHLVAEGQPADVISTYRARLAGTAGHAGAGGPATRWGTGAVRIDRAELLGPNGETRTFVTGEPWTLRVSFHADSAVDSPVFGLAIRHATGTLVSGPNTRMSGYPITRVHGPGVIEYRVDRLPLLPGHYVVAVSVYDRDLVTAYDHWEHCADMAVLERGTRERFGLVSFAGEWSMR